MWIKKIGFALLLFVSTGVKGEDPLVFVHVPKTAGTSFETLLKDRFSPKETCSMLYYYEIGTSKPLKWIFSHKFIWGHFFYSQIKSTPYKKITFVREPIQRVLSEHRYWMKYFVLPKKDLNVCYKGHFLPPGDPLYTMTNHQCLFLSSFDPRDPTISIEQHLRSACSNLEKEFFFVGIADELEASIYSLYALMGWEKPSTIPHMIPTTELIEEYPQELLDTIAKRNWADIQLYEFAKKLFADRAYVSHKS